MYAELCKNYMDKLFLGVQNLFGEQHPVRPTPVLYKRVIV